MAEMEIEYMTKQDYASLKLLNGVKEAETALEAETAKNLGDYPAEWYASKDMVNEAVKDLASKDMVNEAVKDLTTKDMLDSALEALLLKLYPQGSLYISTNSTNPGKVIGGIWEPWSEGRVLVGVNQTDTDKEVIGRFKGANDTGGACARAITKSNLPPWTWTMAKNESGNKTDSIDAIPYQKTEISAGNYFTTMISNYRKYTDNITEPNQEAISVLQPYITCYMWIRTA